MSNFADTRAFARTSLRSRPSLTDRQSLQYRRVAEPNHPQMQAEVFERAEDVPQQLTLRERLENWGSD
jgi:hypothetical protein